MSKKLPCQRVNELFDENVCSNCSTDAYRQGWIFIDENIPLL
jgi:hypothetical protein